MADQNTVPIPQGATIGAPTSAAPAQPSAPSSSGTVPIPAGATLGETVTAPTTPPNDFGTGGNGTVSNLVAGFEKGANKTAQGAIDLLNKGNRALAGGAGGDIPSLPVVKAGEDLNAHGTAENIGEGAENIAEFAAGDEALSGLAKAARVVELGDKYPLIKRTLDLAKEHPVLAKMISEAGKSGVVGGAQGAAKGAAEGNVAGGAEAGAAGGALGSFIASGAAAGLLPLSRILGLGGLTSAEALTKAGRPYVGEQNWTENLKKVLPRLVEADKLNPVKTVGDFEDLAHDTADSLWKQEIQPQIDRHATEALNTIPLRDKLQSAVTPSMQKYFPEDAAKIEQFANNFGQPMTISEANADLQAFNAKLKAYYKASPDARAAILKTDGDVTALEGAASGLRDLLYNHLEAAGENVPRDLRQQYGALKQVERVFGKRATVADRQSPISIGQILGYIAGGTEATSMLLAGHPVAAAAGLVPVAIAAGAKMRNAPESLIRQGLKAATEEAAPSAAKAAVKRAVPAVGGNIGAQAGRFVIQASDGSQHSFPDTPAHRAAVYEADPGHTVISQ
jgi:hypothetical protein